MDFLRAALHDSGAETEQWDEALASVAHVLQRSPKAGLDVTPLEALTGKRPDVSEFRAWGSRAWALERKKQQRDLQPRTSVGCFVGYKVAGTAYRILEDGTINVFERRDVLMEWKPAKSLTSANEEDFGEKKIPVEVSESEDDGNPHGLADDKKRQGQNDEMLPVSTSSWEDINAALGPHRSTRMPPAKITWSEEDPKAYLASGAESVVRDGCDSTKPPANKQEARARPDWPL